MEWANHQTRFNSGKADSPNQQNMAGERLVIILHYHLLLTLRSRIMVPEKKNFDNQTVNSSPRFTTNENRHFARVSLSVRGDLCLLSPKERTTRPPHQNQLQPFWIPRRRPRTPPTPTPPPAFLRAPGRCSAGRWPPPGPGPHSARPPCTWDSPLTFPGAVQSPWANWD